MNKHSPRTAPAVTSVALTLLALVAALTVAGLMKFWPDYDAVAELAERTSYQAEGVEFERGQIIGVSECAQAAVLMPAPPSDRQPGDQLPQPACILLSVGLLSGPDSGQLVSVEVRGNLAGSGVQGGDQVELFSLPSGTVEGGAAEDGSGRQYALAKSYAVSGIMRHLPLVGLALVLVLVVLAVGRLRGITALVGLGFSGCVLLGFVLPALVSGRPGLLVGLVGSSAIMFVTLFLVHGLNLRTVAALIGTLVGLGIIATLSAIAVRVTRLSGFGDELGLLAGLSAELDLRGLISCSILIAGLGVLNDVTITQASSVWELRSAAPELSPRELYVRAMRIGRDHIASTVYTVCFAYAGAALGVLILLYLYNRPMLSLLTQEDIATELVRTMVGSIGLVLAAPVTTAVAALCAASRRAPPQPAIASSSASTSSGVVSNAHINLTRWSSPGQS